MERIRSGLERFSNQAVIIDSIRGSQIIAPVEAELIPTQTTSYTRSLLVPVDRREGKQAQPVAYVMRTQTTRNDSGALLPPG